MRREAVIAVISLISMMVAVCGVEADWSDCEVPCRCRWSGGRKSAICGGAGLRSLPQLHSDIQALDLTNSDLRSLPADAFGSIGLIHLQRLSLRGASITTFHRDAFRHLRILIELDLSLNHIERIPREAFRGNDRLRLLVLSDNPLGELRDDQFPPLAQLKVLELRRCRLASVHPRAFINLQHLETIDLRDNALTNVAEATVDHLASLTMLLLEGNPWRCDCRLRSFRTWYSSKRLSSEQPLCREPPLMQGEPWKNIDPADFACPPKMLIPKRVIHAEPAENITLVCQVYGDPEPSIHWQFRGRPLSEWDITACIVEGDGWSNVTLVSASPSADGEYSCIAESSAGKSRVAVTVVMPDTKDPDDSEEESIDRSIRDTVVTASVAICILLICCFSCSVAWMRRARRGRVPDSRSFVDQRKKLLGNESVELREQASVSSREEPARDVADAGLFDASFVPFVPPPAEFCAVPCGSIFISVQVSRPGEERRFPDLLGGATLPRRTHQTYQPVLEALHAPVTSLTYDNMGPRVTLNGSSTWSLPGLFPPPPEEFVTL